MRSSVAARRLRWSTAACSRSGASSSAPRGSTTGRSMTGRLEVKPTSASVGHLDPGHDGGGQHGRGVALVRDVGEDGIGDGQRVGIVGTDDRRGGEPRIGDAQWPAGAAEGDGRPRRRPPPPPRAATTILVVRPASAAGAPDCSRRAASNAVTTFGEKRSSVTRSRGSSRRAATNDAVGVGGLAEGELGHAEVQVRARALHRPRRVPGDGGRRRAQRRHRGLEIALLDEADAVLEPRRGSGRGLREQRAEDAGRSWRHVSAPGRTAQCRRAISGAGGRRRRAGRRPGGASPRARRSTRRTHGW